MLNLFLMATGVVAVFLSAISVVLAQHRIEHLRSTGETFAQRDVSRSRAAFVVVVIASVAACVMVARNVGWSFALLGFVFTMFGCAYLTLVDIDTHLLPWNDSILVGVTSCAFLVIDAVVRSQSEVIAVMATCGIVTWCVFRFIEWMSRGDLGGGDVVLASVLAAVVGWFGTGAVVNALVYAIVCAGVFALGAMVVSGFRPRTAFAFGPFLIVGAVIVIVTSDPLWVTAQ